MLDHAARVLTATLYPVIRYLTTARAAPRSAGTMLIQPTVENGLRQISVALVFQLRAIDRRRVEERLGSISVEALHEIFAESDKLTGGTE